MRQLIGGIVNHKECARTRLQDDKPGPATVIRFIVFGYAEKKDNIFRLIYVTRIS